MDRCKQIIIGRHCDPPVSDPVIVEVWEGLMPYYFADIVNVEVYENFYRSGWCLDQHRGVEG